MVAYFVLAPSRLLGMLLPILHWQVGGVFTAPALDAVFRLTFDCRMLYMCVFSFTLPGIALERLLSVVHVGDYEERPRVYISLGIIAIVDVLSLVCVVATTIDDSIVVMGVSLGLVVLTNTFAIYAFYAWYKRTMRLYTKRFSCIGYERRRGFTDAYSLRRRFQIQENIRIVQLIKRIYTASLTFLVFCVAVMLPLLVADALSFRNFLIEGMDIAIAAFANLISLVILSGIPAFRGGLKLLNMCRRRVQVEHGNGSGVRNAFGTQLMFGHRDETEVYFQLFRDAWDNHA